ncbi:MAG: transcription antitermination factor NusB [Phycisphaerales bacterium]
MTTPAEHTHTDMVRRLGFESVYRLPQFDFAGASSSQQPALDADSAMQSLTPDQRDRVHNVATRRLAFQLLYQLDASGVQGNPGPVVIEELGHVADLGPVASDKVSALVLGAWAGRAQADAAFTALAPQWPSHRQAGVDRAILRLAHHEITRGLTPHRIAINEAVELARAFSTDKSPAFINALLDEIAAKAAASGGGAS